MTAYALAQISIHDRDRYQRYVAAFAPVLASFGGRLLATEEAPETVEGAWPYDKLILIAFESREALDAWRTSAAYEEISRDRRAATDGVVLLLRGLD